MIKENKGVIFMLFDQNIVVKAVWALDGCCKKSKPQAVGGRAFHSLSLRRSGVVRFRCGNDTLVSRAGGITFMPAGSSYITEVLEDSELRVVHFETVQKIDHSPFCIEGAETAELKSLFAALCSGATGGYQSFSLFYALLASLDRPLVPKRMRQAKDRIDQNYAEPLTVAALAAEAGLSEVHFRNEFKRYFGLPPLAYLKRVRMEQASRLLLSGYYSVAEVAVRCGFDSISYFSYEFRRLKGMPPSDYQKASLV